MTVSYLQRIAKVDSLYKAWLLISDSTKSYHRNTSGIDGQSVNQFAARADEYLRHLRGRILSVSGYEFSALKPHLEEKGRVICVPTVRDRIVQRAVLDALAENEDYRFETDVSYGFLKGRSVRQAITESLRIRNRKQWAYKTDIKKFFDSIDRARLNLQIKRRIRPPTIHKLLFDAAMCEVKPRNSRQQKQIHQAGLRRNVGLRQGMPLSPYLSNLFLYEFDKRMIANQVSMVRYADDLIVFTNSQQECEDIHDLFVNELSKLGLTIDPIGTGKTSVSSPGERAEFLGVELVPEGAKYVAIVPSKKVLDRKAEILSYANLDLLIKDRITISSLTKQLDDKIVGWKHAYDFCSNIEAFSHILHAARQKVIENIFVKELGLNGLTKNQKRFLEIL